MKHITIDEAAPFIKAPLIHQGKVREMFDIGKHYLMVATDRISAFDYILSPGIPNKGKVLNKLSHFWFDATKNVIPNHFVDVDLTQFKDIFSSDFDLLKERVMIVKKAKRINIECVVRGYLAGNGWRQYVKTGAINGLTIKKGYLKNARLDELIFTPAIKNDVGHDEDISFKQMCHLLGDELAHTLKETSLKLYQAASQFSEKKGLILADTKLEFGFCQGELILIDEAFTPDSSRYWSFDKYALGTEIDSLDKEPLRQFLLNSKWDRNSKPETLPKSIVEETALRYQTIFHRLIKESLNESDNLCDNQKKCP